MSAPGTEPDKDAAFADPPAAAEIDLARVHGSILREPPDPAEGQGRVPAWFAIGILALTLWGVLYLANRGGGFRANVFAPMAAAPAAPIAPEALGQHVYVRNCVLCHQMSGTGVGAQYPPLAGSEWVTSDGGRHPGQLVAILLHGIEGPFEVRGRVYNGAMPPWRFLKDEEIAAVLSYLRRSWGNDAAPITPEFVGRVRAATRERSGPWSQADLLAMPPMENAPAARDGH